LVDKYLASAQRSSTQNRRLGVIGVKLSSRPSTAKSTEL
jgi:hypothetical protein